jgi:hypothetical protein
MTLQNRVTPWGSIVATPERGAWMGNRGGCFHDERQQLTNKRWVTKQWITCRLEFKGWHREVMTPRRYTELFFLDEATALAAGHRPCGECRREAYRRFKATWLAANRDRGLGHDALIGAIDRELHRDRLGPDGRPRTYPARLGSLPDGVFVILPDAPEAFLVWRGGLAPWSPAGYGAFRTLPRDERVKVLTPRSTTTTITAGYTPAVHSTITGPVAVVALR